jgi:hypothetical protein
VYLTPEESGLDFLRYIRVSCLVEAWQARMIEYVFWLGIVQWRLDPEQMALDKQED